MKISAKHLPLICAITFSTLAGCKKTSNKIANTVDPPPAAPTASFTINGDDYVNQPFKIDGKAGIVGDQGLYFTTHTFTSVFVSDADIENGVPKNSVQLYVDGNKTGQQLFGTKFANPGGTQENVDMMITVTRTKNGKDEELIFYTNGDLLNNQPSGTINITKYDAVNGTIEGTFSGKFIDPFYHKIVDVTDGHFVAPRNADQAL